MLPSSDAHLSHGRVAILGGTGFVGRAVCEALARRHPDVTLVVPTRRLAHAKGIRHLPTVEIHQADVHQLEDLKRVLRGCSAVVHLVAILHGRAEDFHQVHVALPATLVQACAEEGVRRVVHVSALGVGDDAPSLYLKSKTEGEQVLRNAALDCTILRPSVIFGAEDRFMNTFAALQRLAPVMPLAGAQARFQPVWVEDVAQAIVTALEDRSTIAEVIECAGPDVFTLGELVQLAGRLSGHARPVLPLPDWIGRLQALAMEFLPGEPLMSRDNIASMQVPNVASANLPDLKRLGIMPASLHAVAPGYLAPGQGCARLDAWRARAGRRR